MEGDPRVGRHFEDDLNGGSPEARESKMVGGRDAILLLARLIYPHLHTS